MPRHVSAFVCAPIRAFLILALAAGLAGCEPGANGMFAPPTAGTPVPAAQREVRAVDPDVLTGERALAADDLALAKRAFDLAVRKRPDDGRALVGLAETVLRLGDIDAARRIFGSIAGNPPGIEARLLQGRGLIALAEQDAARAVTFLGTAVQRDKTLWRAWLALGQAHDQLGQPDAARRAYAAAENNAPARAPVYNDIGMSFLRQDRPIEAVRYFERALAVDPGYERARGNLRIARAMTGAYEDAIAGATKAQMPDVLNNVGYVAIMMGDFEVADRYLRRAVEESPVYHEAAVANLDLLARVSAGTATVPRRQVPRQPVRPSQAAMAETPPPDKRASETVAAKTPRGELSRSLPPVAAEAPSAAAPVEAERTFRWATADDGVSAEKDLRAAPDLPQTGRTKPSSAIETADIPPPQTMRRPADQAPVRQPGPVEAEGDAAMSTTRVVAPEQSANLASRTQPRRAARPSKKNSDAPAAPRSTTGARTDPSDGSEEAAALPDAWHLRHDENGADRLSRARMRTQAVQPQGRQFK